MKLLLTALISAFVLNAHAGIRTKHFTVHIDAPTEQALIEEGKRSMALIEEGKLRSVFHETSQCWPNNSRYIKVLGMKITKSVSFTDEGEAFSNFRGAIRYIHKHCRDER